MLKRAGTAQLQRCQAGMPGHEPDLTIFTERQKPGFLGEFILIAEQLALEDSLCIE